MPCDDDNDYEWKKAKKDIMEKSSTNTSVSGQCLSGTSGSTLVETSGLDMTGSSASCQSLTSLSVKTSQNQDDHQTIGDQIDLGLILNLFWSLHFLSFP